jgi:photosystem II stability/assembly factor-like uncharacterized protein
MIEISSDGGDTWTGQTTIITQPLWASYFLNKDTGFCVSRYGAIIRTLNGGLSWSKTVIDLSIEFRDITFSNHRNGFAVGHSGTSGIIAATTNIGDTWSLRTFELNCCPETVCFVNDSLGYIGSSGIIAQTTNYGNNWVQQYDAGQVIRDIKFFNSLRGYAVGAGGTILSTTNGGVDWIPQASNTSVRLNSICIINLSTIIVSGNGLILKTTNSGVNWNMLANIDGESFSMCFPSSTIGYTVTTSSKIYKTTNSGAIWNTLYSPINETLYSVFFADTLCGYITGLGGNVIKTTDGGGIITNVKHITDISVPKSFSLYQNYPNPFNPSTKIKFLIPLLGGVSEGRGGLVNLTIYDILGREVATLVNESLKPGTYEVEFEGSNYASGVYFYKLITQDYSETRKLILLK